MTILTHESQDSSFAKITCNHHDDGGNHANHRHVIICGYFIFQQKDDCLISFDETRIERDNDDGMLQSTIDSDNDSSNDGHPRHEYSSSSNGSSPNGFKDKILESNECLLIPCHTR